MRRRYIKCTFLYLLPLEHNNKRAFTFYLLNMTINTTTHSVTSRPRQGRAFPARSLGKWRRTRGSTSCGWTESWGWGSYSRRCSPYRTDSAHWFCCSRPTCLSAQRNNEREANTIKQTHTYLEKWPLKCSVCACFSRWTWVSGLPLYFSSIYMYSWTMHPFGTGLNFPCHS